MNIHSTRYVTLIGTWHWDTQLKTLGLLYYRIEQRFAAHIVHSCQQYETILFMSLGVTMLNIIVYDYFAMCRKTLSNPVRNTIATSCSFFAVTVQIDLC